ncbi:hypothetical protein DVH05_023777 [Phytophthora capsici]|nr:hypothetical protein DVH05_023777 [Phytophthora capsici]
MVKPRGKVPRDSEVTGRDLSFKSVWRELKQDGWTRKPPPRSSLDDRYKYIRPEGHPNGTVGLDYFLGEAAVLDFYADVLRSRARGSSLSVSAVGRTSSASAGDQLAAAQEVVRQNYLPDIDAAAARGIAASRGAATANDAGATRVEPQPPQRSELPESRTTREPARRSLDTSAAFRSSPPCAARGPSLASPLIATSPHVGEDSLETEGAGLLSSPEVVDDDASVASAEVHTGDESIEDELDALGNELLADKHDDLNAVESGDIGDQYGAIESGDEAENDDVDLGEYDSDRSVEEYCAPEVLMDDVDETEAEIAEEVLFGENFLESFGGADEVLAGNLKDSVLRCMSATGWEDVVEPDIHEHMMEPYEPVGNSTSYPGLRQGYSGPSAEALRHGDSPIALFFYFLPVVLWQHIAGCSNDYHREMLPLRIDAAYSRYRKKQRRRPDLPRKTRRDIQNELETMKPIMPHELCRFMGC